MRVFRIILLESIFIIALFLLSEFSGRVYFYIKHGYTLKESFLYEPDETLIYKINDNYKGGHGRYHLGIRKDYFEKDKKDKIRIVCLGGSITFGHAQVDNSKVWTEILERMLNKERVIKRYEVLNGGVAGYGSSNILARLKKDILGLKPDIVIVCEGWNLVGSLKSKYAWVPDNIYFRKQPIFKRINNFLIANSILYIKLREVMVKDIIRGINEKHIEEAIDKVYKKELPIFENDLEEIIATCKQNNIISILIKYPSRDHTYRRYRDTIRVIEGIALRDSIYVIDCSSWFESLDDKERAGYFVDMAHYSDKGNEKMAEIICRALINFV